MAWQRFTAAIEKDPEDPLQFNNFGVLYLELDQPEIVQTLFKQAIAADPDFHLAYYNLGAALDQTGQHQQADKHYNQGRRLALTKLESSPWPPQSNETSAQGSPRH